MLTGGQRCQLWREFADKAPSAEETSGGSLCG
jgi:hypothetical protein